MKIINQLNIRCWVLMLLTISSSVIINAQTIYDSTYVSRSEALSDLDQLDRKFSSNYKAYDLPNLIEAYKSKLKEVRANLPERMTLDDFRLEVLEVLSSLKEAHITTRFTHPTKRKKELKKEFKKNRDVPTLLPFDVILEGPDILRVTYDYRPDSIQVEELDSIVKFGHMSIKELLDYAEPRMNTDIDESTIKRRFLAGRLPRGVRSYLRPMFQDSVEVVYINNGLKKKTWIQYTQTKKKKDFQRFRMIDSLSTGIVALSSFRTLPYGNDLKKWRNLHRVGLDTIAKYNPKNLIIDLRNNGGGSAKYCRRWLSGFLDRGDRIYDTNGHAILLIPFLSSIRFKVGNKTKFTRRAKPKSNAYNGNVYVLINEGVYSAGMIFAKGVQENNRATLIGQPTGQKSYGTHAGYYKPLKLSNSGIVINIPQIYFKLDDRSIDELTIEGVQPDILLPYEFDVNNSKEYDATMQYVLKMIAQK